MIDRHQARTLALQALCQAEVLRESFIDQLDEFLADDAPPSGVQAYARTLVQEAWRQLEKIDALIQTASENWKVARMAPVDRNILRVAVCELLTHPETPPHVAIDEAVEIGKAFGTADSSAFINGVLDSVYKSLNKPAEAEAEAAATQGPVTG